MRPATRHGGRPCLAALMVLGLLPAAWAGAPVRAAGETDATTPNPVRRASAIRLTLGESPAQPGVDPSTETGTESRPPVNLSVLVSGDVLIHDTVWEAARTDHGFDFTPLLAAVRPTVRSADLALCHLETPLAPTDGPYRSYPLFSVPPQIATALHQTGYDGCTTASNHTVDQGTAGVVRTLAALDASGLAHTGSARTRAEARRIVTFTRQGVTIAWLAYTYGTNGMPVDPARPWSVNLIEVDRILADAARARRAGADAVLVALHWGEEYQTAPSAFQREVAERIARSPDVTLIYGHHAHVVQPVERIHHTWVAFGLGNHLADQATIAPGVDDGLMVRFTLRRDRNGRVDVVGRPELIRTRIARNGGPHVELASG